MDKKATTDFSLAEPLAHRHSPRAFDPESELTDEQIGSLLEAARWSASSSNSQPWRLYVARRGTNLHREVFDTLASGNQAWAGDAACLIVNVAKMVTEDGSPEKWAVYDVGQAAAHLSVQATSMGLVTHQMGGFDKEAMSVVLGLDESHTPWAVIAVGPAGDPSRLSEKLQEREKAPRTRKTLEEIAPNWR